MYEIVEEEIEVVRYYLQQIGEFEGDNIVNGKRRRTPTNRLENQSFAHY
jgi:hypothetical protein